MNKHYKLMGDIYLREDVSISSDKSVIDILNHHAGGLKGTHLNFVQIGGALGQCLIGEDLLKPLEHFEEPFLMDTIMYFSDLFCPVDYFRFVTRFMIRELRIDTLRIRKLNELIEDIANSKARMSHIQVLREMVSEKVDTKGERLANDVFLFILDHFHEDFVQHIRDNKCKNSICRGLMSAQCINACPADVNIPGYVALMKSEENDLAYALMRQTNPLSLICGKVCARPCETRCRRGEIESSVGVRALQRFASEMALNIHDFKESKLPSNGKTVSIVGSGPAGLTAAYFLARTGYNVTIYEAMAIPGGMLASGIPEYRLPYKDLAIEIKTITDLGVEIKTNTRVGKDISYSRLKEISDAVILATGAHIGNTLPQYKFNEIETAISLLADVKLKNRRSIGKNVAIIGGGDVALDAARTCLRIGAETVNVISLEEWHQMPASIEERNFALEEGVKFISSFGTKDIIKDTNNHNLSLTLQKCTQVFDIFNHFSPTFDSETTQTLSVNSIILAIGQKPDLSFSDNCLETNRSCVVVDPTTYMTNEAGVFAAGDMTKPMIAAQAIADGKNTANQVDQYLGGTGLYIGEEIKFQEPQLSITTWDVPLVSEETFLPKDLFGNFEEITRSYSLEDAKIEAGRCLRCDRNSTEPLLLRPMKR